MIFNQYYYFRNYPEPNTFKENRIIGNAGGKYLFIKDSDDNLSNMKRRMDEELNRQKFLDDMKFKRELDEIEAHRTDDVQVQPVVGL